MTRLIILSLAILLGARTWAQSRSPEPPSALAYAGIWQSACEESNGESMQMVYRLTPVSATQAKMTQTIRLFQDSQDCSSPATSRELNAVDIRWIGSKRVQERSIDIIFFDNAKMLIHRQGDLLFMGGSAPFDAQGFPGSLPLKAPLRLVPN